MSEWVGAKERLPENAKHPGAFCPKYKVATKYGVTDGWYNPDRESWYVLFWFMTDRFLPSEIDFERGDVPRVVKVSRDAGFVTHWMPEQKPPEDSTNTCTATGQPCSMFQTGPCCHQMEEVKL